MIRSGAVSLSLMMTAHGAAQAPLHLQPDQGTTLRPLAVTQLDERQHGSDLDSTRPLTITLSHATPIDAATGRTVQKTAEPQAFTEGVVLSVTPQIAGDGLINMGIAPSLTARTGQATSRFGDTAPILKVRDADTIVRVRENETVVIAGLLDERVQHDVRKVPVLGGLPGIGAMFRGETTSRHKSDLVILLTPTVMTPARVTQSTAQQLERVSTR